AAGEFALIIPNQTAFYMGLAGIVVGNGLFKPNISTLVGKLYREGDPRRDSGFTIFYMGINIGAFAAPLACAWIANVMGAPQFLADGVTPLLDADGAQVIIADYRYGFMMAGGGMLLGILTFTLGKGLLKGEGGAPKGREGFAPTLLVFGVCVLLTPVIYFLLAQDVWAGRLLLTLSGIMIVYLLYTGIKLGSVVLQRMFALLILLFVNSLFFAC